MLQKQFIQLFSLTFFIIMFSQISFSQNVNKDEIILEIKKADKVKEIKKGKVLRIWYEGEKHKGRLDSISTHSIFIEDTEYEINKIDKIGIKYRSTQITGAVIGTAGLVITSLGTYLIIEASNTDGLDAGEAIVKVIFLTAFGVILDAVGITATAIGTSVFFIGKKYNTEKGWSFESVQMN